MPNCCKYELLCLPFYWEGGAGFRVYQMRSEFELV